MQFVKLTQSEFIRIEKNKPVTVVYLGQDISNKYKRTLIRGLDIQSNKEVVFPLYENIKIALKKIPLKIGDMLRLTWVGEMTTKNGITKKFDVEYAPYESILNELTDEQKRIIDVYKLEKESDTPPF